EPDWSSYIAHAQDGDRRAYQRLLEEITPYLPSLAARRMPNRSDVEDAVQDALLTIHAVRHTYDPSRPFGPWLVAIASRRVVDGLRRRGRTGARESPLDAEHETFAAPEANYHEAASEARAVGWLLFAALMLALLAVSHEVRPDLALRLRQPEFVAGIAASLATGVLAASASFLLSIPDRSRAWLLLPLPALLVWVSTIGYGCLINWVSLQPGSLPFGNEAGCFALLVLTGVPLSLAML